MAHHDLSKGERTPRPEHRDLAGVVDPGIRQLHDQFSLEADVLYLLAQNRDNFLSDASWQEAKTKIEALNPDRFPFSPVTPPQPEPSGVTFTWVGSPNMWPGELRPGECNAIVQHTAVGSRQSVRNVFQNRYSQVSTTGLIALNGDVDLYGGWFDAMWGNGVVEPGALPQLIALFQGFNPNQRTLSFEREDGGDPKLPVPESQVRGAIAAYRAGLAAHPECGVLTGHNCISPQSRTCPESAWLDTGLLREIAAELNLEYMEF